MKKWPIFIISVVVVIAAWLTFFAPSRYGTHGDSLPCGQNQSKVTHLSLTAYLLFSQANEPSRSSIGTCPYQNYESQTYAGELWLISIILAIFIVSNNKKRESTLRNR